MLFLCRANSARSITAEALLRQLGSDRFDAFSGGVEPAGEVHTLTLAQLRPTIIDLSSLRPKDWREFVKDQAPRMHVVIALGDEVAEHNAPMFPGSPVFCQWTFPDPLAEHWSDREQERAFERVFGQMLRRISVVIARPFPSMKASEQRSAVNDRAQTDTDETPTTVH